MPVQTNAELVAVRAGGRVDEWDGAGASPAPRWEGTRRAYYREREVRETGTGGATNRRLKRELIVDVVDVVALELDVGDVLTFTRDDRPGPLEARATIIPTPTLAGVPSALQTSRIVLEDT